MLLASTHPVVKMSTKRRRRAGVGVDPRRLLRVRRPRSPHPVPASSPNSTFLRAAAFRAARAAPGLNVFPFMPLALVKRARQRERQTQKEKRNHARVAAFHFSIKNRPICGRLMKGITCYHSDLMPPGRTDSNTPALKNVSLII